MAVSVNRPIYTRNFKDRLSDEENYGATNDAFAMCKRFDNMVNKVEDMISKTSIYSPWIRIQFGPGNNPITFNTATNENDRENIIASLELTKSGSGVANNFKLVVIWNPYNYGQNPSEKLQGLDDLVALAMDVDNTTTSYQLKGYIQYGYNYTENDELVSPKYEFILTQASADVKTSTGVTTYTFEGYSVLSLDCDFSNITYGEINDWNLMDLVGWTLYYYYGDPAYPPIYQEIDTSKPIFPNSPGYRIDIPKEYYEECAKEDGHRASVPTRQNVDLTPWNYCLNVMNSAENVLTITDEQSGKYSSLSELKTNEIPYWTLYLTEEDGVKTIHVTHTSPLLNDDRGIKNAEGETLESKKTFTWGYLDGNYNGNRPTATNSLVTKWTTNANLYLYLIRKTSEARNTGDNVHAAQEAYNEANNEYIAAVNNGVATKSEIDTKKAARQSALDKLNEMLSSYLKQELDDEIYDTTMELVGIPADIPINMKMRIIPRVLEDIPSRQAGIYGVTGATDYISTSGIYRTEIKLLRQHSLDYDDGADINLSKEKVVETPIKAETKKVSYSSGGRRYWSIRRRYFIWRPVEVLDKI